MGVGTVGVGKRHGVKSLELEDFHEHDGVGAIAAGDAEDVLDAGVQANAVDSLYPRAAVEGEAGPLGDGDESAGVGVINEDIVQVDRLIAGGYQYFYGDGGGDA
jgi:hypothetical protein